MDKPLVLVGRFGAAHGVKGEIRLKSFTQEPAAIARYGPLGDADGRVFTITSVRPLKDDMLVVRLDGVATRDAAEALTGVELYAERSRLPSPDADEFYHVDLIGLDAMSEAGEPLGRVVGVLDYGAGDILEIAPPAGASLLVPFTRRNVPVLDFAAGRLVVVPLAEAAEEPDAAATGEEE